MALPTNLTDCFVDEIHSLSGSSMPKSAVYHARRCLLDYLAATIAGASMAKDKNHRLLDNLSAFDAQVNVIGMERKSGLLTAALVNGISSHQAELDDGVISGIVHPGSPIFSALLPVAQSRRINGDALLQATIIGYEATVRLADAIQPSHKRRGYHATGTCGAVGAAIALAVLTGASRSQLKDTLSAATVSASGSLKVLEGNSQLKPYNPGQAAVTAMLAHSLAEAGFEGPDDALDGPTGFLQMMSDDYQSERLFALSENPAIERVYFKPFAACRYCHPAIEAALMLRSNDALAIDQINRIDISTYELAVNQHDHTCVDSVSSAKMSIPFSVAVALISGNAGMEQFHPSFIGDNRLKRLMQKISVHADPVFSASFPNKTSARIEIEMVNGSIKSAEVHDPKGDPTNPMTDQEVSQKFLSLTQYAGMASDKANLIRDLIWAAPLDTDQLVQLL